MNIRDVNKNITDIARDPETDEGGRIIDNSEAMTKARLSA